MRIAFRKSLKSQSLRNRVLFFAPILGALALLLLFTQNRAVLAAGLRSPLAMLSARSPGGRGAGALYNIKPGRMAKAAAVKPALPGPHERVLAATHTRPVLPVADALSPDISPTDLIMGPPAVDSPGFTNFGVPSVTQPGGFVPASFSSPSGCCAGGVAPTPDPSPTPTPDPTPTPTETASPPGVDPTPPVVVPTPPITSAVPEPATWAMNILGLFAIGGVLRRRNRKLGASRRGSIPPVLG